MSVSGTKKGEVEFVMAIAGGASVREASQIADISPRTGSRWLNEDPKIAKAVTQARDALYKATFGKLVSAGDKAVATLVELLEADSEQCRLGAARAVLEHLSKSRELVEHSERIAEIERRLDERGNPCVTGSQAA